VKKRTAPPTALFETLLSIVTPPLYSPLPQHRDKYKTLQSLPEYEVPAHASEGFKRTFQKKFGKNLNARAEHMSHTLLQMVWGDFNNFKSVGLVITKHQILKAINTASDSNHPLSELSVIRTRETGVVDERKYDKERINKTHIILQLAMDRVLPLLPQGKLRAMVERAVNRVVAYKRKMHFVRHKLVSGGGVSGHSDAAHHTSTPTATAISTHPTTTTTTTIPTPSNITTNPTATSTANNTTTTSSTPEEARGALDLASPGVLHTVLPITRTLELPLPPTLTVADLDLEVDISVCRVYFDVLDKLYVLSRAVQSLKNSWHNSSLRRAVAARKTAQMKQSMKDSYLSDRHADKVKLVWLKHKRIETSKKKLDIIMKGVHARRARAKFALSFVPRFGWENAYDENGYLYWYDTKPRHPEESTYDMPQYSLPQYYAVHKLQRAAREYVVRQFERKLVREAEARAEVERIAVQMEIERKKGLRVVKSVFGVYERLISRVTGSSNTSAVTPKHSAHTTHHNSHNSPTAVPSIEQLLPWRFRFEEQPVFRSGHWALLKINTASVNTTHASTAHSSTHTTHASGGHIPHYLEATHHLDPHHHDHITHNTHTTHTNHNTHTTHTTTPEPLHKQYEIVVIFRLKAEEQVCDVRNTKGKTLRNIPLKRLFQMNLDVQMAVETRYKQERVFYNSVITHIDTTTEAEFMYSIRYEDGETAAYLKRDAIRPSLHTLRSFMNGREQALKLARVQHKRLLHYANLKKQRILAQNSRALGRNGVTSSGGVGGTSSNDNVLLLHDGSISRPESPVLLLENNRQGEAQNMRLNSNSEEIGFSRDEAEPMLLLENNEHNEHAMNNDDSSAKYSNASTALVTVPSESDLHAHNSTTNNTTNNTNTINTKHTLVRIGSVSHDIHDAAATTEVAPVYRIDLKLHLYYSRVCNRYGWNTYTDNTNTYYTTANTTNNTAAKYYVNQFTEQIVDTQPVYDAAEVQAAARLQRAWLLYTARCKTYRKVLHIDVVGLIQSCIRRCAKIAYVGFELEGLTAMQMLRRAGYWELAEVCYVFTILSFASFGSRCVRSRFATHLLLILLTSNAVLYYYNKSLTYYTAAAGDLLQSHAPVITHSEHRVHRPHPQGKLRGTRHRATHASERTA